MKFVWGLNRKIVLALLAILVGVLAPGFFFITETAERALHSELKRDAVVVSQIVQESVAMVLNNAQNGKEHLQTLAERFGEADEVMWVEVFDRNATVVAHSLKDRVGKKPLKIHEDYVRKIFETGGVIEEEDRAGGRFNRFAPVYGGGSGQQGPIVSVVELVMDLGVIGKKISALRTQMFFIAAVLAIAIWTLLTWFLRKIVIFPISRLSAAAKRIAEGDLGQRVGINSRDEVGELAASFDEMAGEIQKRNEALRSANEELTASNEELQAATEELEVSNEELKNTQEKLIEQEKLAAVGRLASGVGHELRNPLGVIKNAVYYIKSKIGSEDSKLLKHTNIVEAEIERANKIVSDLLGFSRSRPPALVPSDLNRVVESALEAVTFPANIRLVKVFGENLSHTMIDPDQMRQVFINLAVNAVQALTRGGELKVLTRQNGVSAEVEFADTGCGIAREDMAKLFDPFFTTKARGIGLGLAVTRGIVEKHNGTVKVSSEAGKGARFTVMLPLEKRGT